VAETIKILGQRYPAAATLEDLYTVPAGKYTVVSSIAICNKGGIGSNDPIRLAIRQGGAGVTDKQYIYYDLPVDTSDTIVWTGGVTLATGDVVSVRSQNGQSAFNIFGSENDI
jgi:hypothetical protein